MSEQHGPEKRRRVHAKDAVKQRHDDVAGHATVSAMQAQHEMDETLVGEIPEVEEVVAIEVIACNREVYDRTHRHREQPGETRPERLSARHTRGHRSSP